MIVARDAVAHQASSQIAVHPLITVNIADHVTRRALDHAAAPRAVGCLLGQQLGRRLEVHTSFELAYALRPNTDGTPGDHAVVDMEHLKSRRERYLAVFPDYDVVGWYTTGTGLSAQDVSVTHDALLSVNENSIALVMDTMPPPGKKQLPLYVFETRASFAGQTRTVSLAKVNFTVESEESERIGVDAAMRVDFDSETNPTLVPHAERFTSALSMLRVRIEVVLAYLRAVHAGSVAPDYELLRRISSIANQLPRADSTAFRAAFDRDYEDGLLIAFLGVVAKGTLSLTKLVGDTALATQEQQSRKRGGGHHGDRDMMSMHGRDRDRPWQ
jgi:COP9 signalosome complex subunit 6